MASKIISFKTKPIKIKDCLPYGTIEDFLKEFNKDAVKGNRRKNGK